MVFSSYLFLFYFLPAALLLYYASPPRGRHLILTIVSYVFYGWANPLFVPLLMFSTVVDHLSAHAIHRWRGTLRARRVLVGALCTNLALLGFFKYYNFGADNLTANGRSLPNTPPKRQGVTHEPVRRTDLPACPGFAAELG